MRSTATSLKQTLETPHSVLVVDDEHEIRDSLVFLLKACGYAVSGAVNGADALAQIDRRNPPHVIILDLIMPEMNGFEFLSLLRRDPSLRDIYVIVVSATDRPPALAADAFFQKPYPVTHMLTKLEQLCIAHEEMEKLRAR